MKIKVNYKMVLLVVWEIAFVAANQLWAHAEKAFCLQGRIGQKTIAVKIICYDETPSTRNMQYFFTTDKRDRYLVGKPENGAWRFAADGQAIPYFPKPEGTLTITENGSNWQGSFTSQQGKKQAIVLTPIPANFIPPQFSHLPLVQQMDPYERYRVTTLHFIKNTTQKWANGTACSNYIERESGVSFFRLEAGSSKVNMSNVNAALEATHLSLVQKYFAYSPQKITARPTTTLLYLSNELVSFRTVFINRLLTLTTTQIQQATTLDVPTGEILKPEAIFWLDKTTSPPPAGDFFTLYQYRKRVFAPAVFQWLQALYPEKMKAARCGINNADTWNLPAWNLTATGVALGINSADDCGTFQWAIIPYEKLKPFISRKYHLSLTK